MGFWPLPVSPAWRWGRKRRRPSNWIRTVPSVSSTARPGLPPTELEKVFQPFYRVETSRNRDTGGSGLGLALARDVFRRLGGDLSLANGRDSGLVATAWLPADIAG